MPARQNNKLHNRGVTLVEVMISLVILLLVFMGLIQASLLSIDHNVRNGMRDEGVKVAAESIAKLKEIRFNNPALDQTGTPPGFVDFPVIKDPETGIVDPYSGPSVKKYSRNMWMTYFRKLRVTDLDPGPNLSLKRVEVQVSYTDTRGEQHTYTISSTVRNR